MQLLNESLKQKGITKAFPTWTSNYCYEHIPPHVMPKEPTADELAVLQQKFRVQMILMDSEEVCPRCECEKSTAILAAEIKHNADHLDAREKIDVFHKKSIFQDETLKYAKFETYEISDNEHEANTNKQTVMRLVEDYKRGYQFNLWLTGNVGVGKSHLAVSMLKELRDVNTSCLFIDVDEMLRRIRASFNNKESIYTEQYFIDLLTSVDFLVLDDLGAETGNIDTDRQASDYTSKILRAILNGRQDKSTIITTNLKHGQLIKIYDPKLIDRALKNKRIVKFAETQSFRSRDVDF